jgi:ferric-dicitrate binding protein FerR (iron transport regulator)
VKGDRLSQQATQALQPFRRLGTPVEDEAVAAARRDELVPLIGNRIRAVTVRQRRWRRAKSALAAAAVAAGLALAVTQGNRLLTDPDRPSGPERSGVLSSGAAVSLVRQGRPVEPSREPRALLAGDRIVTSPDAPASIVLLGGARVEADPSTRITLVRAEPPEQRLRLEAGKVELEVPKLAAGSAFVVETADAEVRVRGTRFSVEVSGSGAGVRTRVGVARGSVLVRTARGESVLSGGDTWSSPLAAALPAEPAQRGAFANDSARVTEDRSRSQPASNTGAPAAFAEAEARGAAAEATPSTTPGQRASEVASRGESLPRASDTPGTRARGDSDALAKQNGLMQAALAARRSGDHGEAVELLDELLRNHPGSPLTESARVERFRSLRRLGRHTEATREARRYLASYGRGFARDEARGLVLGSETASGSAPKR